MQRQLWITINRVITTFITQNKSFQSPKELSKKTSSKKLQLHILQLVLLINNLYMKKEHKFFHKQPVK